MDARVTQDEMVAFRQERRDMADFPAEAVIKTAVFQRWLFGYRMRRLGNTFFDTLPRHLQRLFR